MAVNTQRFVRAARPDQHPTFDDTTDKIKLEPVAVVEAVQAANATEQQAIADVLTENTVTKLVTDPVALQSLAVAIAPPLTIPDAFEA